MTDGPVTDGPVTDGSATDGSATDGAATDGAAVEGVTFYWRPGCGFCARLERRLVDLDVPLDRRNIWEDEAAAAVVRSIARGNETVPTVVVGTVGMVNPSADEVVDAIRRHAPGLLPNGR